MTAPVHEGDAAAGARSAPPDRTDTPAPAPTGSTAGVMSTPMNGGGAGAQPTPQGGHAAGTAGTAPGRGVAPASPALPPVIDPSKPGPFGADVVATAPGLSTHMLFVPAKLGENGVKHPIIVWTNGAGGSTNFYEKLQQHFASHGFFVVADKMSGSHHDAEIVEQKAGIEWATQEAARAASPYAGKLDASRIAVAGHSLGSVSSFASAADRRIKASIHWSAGLTGNPVGAPEEWLQGLHAPAAFFCGQAEPRALPRCSGDFDNAPANVPVFYGTLEGATHTSTYDEPNAGEWGRAGVAWFRFALAGDESFRSWFQAPTCTLCSGPWLGKSRGI